MNGTIDDVLNERKVVDVLRNLGQCLEGRAHEGDESPELGEYIENIGLSIRFIKSEKPKGITFEELRKNDPEVCGYISHDIRYCVEKYGFEV